ncbi:Alpha/Beta hydrolase protein [Gamsiella multidivaricata]|uniref:Alpha/Beta hydrolase protein n=1 Tax=Gamsiella multidivaricata TaxID=101098 RepID=UPI0022203C22|nr:Alpha/Beta hydrolase protein [Gamsiella multidivaricata]KAG0367585.1 Kynurenine formamidase [Gamsiella multidivaricata]KAI7816264.1 Alpha/Beta hydrolase protein [Gamsiella multidivaricata]
MTVVRDIVYAPVSDWEKHTLDLYCPQAQANPHRSLIVFVHGGAWRTGDKNGFIDLAKNLADSTGDAVAVVNYTLSIAAIKNDPTSVPSKAQHPKHVQDVALAIGYLYTHAQTYGTYNPEHIFLVGHSAGGHITGLLALRPDQYLEPIEADLGLTKGTLHSAIRGVVGVEGIYNADRLLKRWPSYRDFIIQGFGQDPATLIHGSPAGQEIPQDSGFVLPRYAVIQSTQDELVDSEQASDYYVYLQSLASTSGDGVALEFGDWGTHDEMLQTPQFTKTITTYIHGWETSLE